MDSDTPPPTTAPCVHVIDLRNLLNNSLQYTYALSCSVSIILQLKQIRNDPCLEAIFW